MKICQICADIKANHICYFRSNHNVDDYPPKIIIACFVRDTYWHFIR